MLLVTTAPGRRPCRYPARLSRDVVVAGCCPLAEAAALLAGRPAPGPTEVWVLLAPDSPRADRERILALHGRGRPVRLVPWRAPAAASADGRRAVYRFPLSRRAARRKRALDLMLTLPALLVALPLIAALAAIIRWDSPGPVLIRQLRYGLDGRPFRMYKLRTMYHQPGETEATLLAATPEATPTPGHAFKLPDDPRITRVGRPLRRSSLDELPQLLNVLRGEMSLVGPRPALPWVVAQLAPAQLARFALPPGMTGWWQVHGRSNNPLHLNTDRDLYYVQHYSLALDLRILAATVREVIRGTGAY